MTHGGALVDVSAVERFATYPSNEHECMACMSGRQGSGRANPTTLCPIFPAQGDFDFVLTANDEEMPGNDFRCALPFP